MTEGVIEAIKDFMSSCNLLRIKIVEYFDTQTRFAEYIRDKYGIPIDSSVVSRIKRKQRTPSPQLMEIFEIELKTSAERLFPDEHNRKRPSAVSA